MRVRLVPDEESKECHERFGVKPRQYQLSAYRKYLTNLTLYGHHGGLIMTPVGSGKSLIMHLMTVCFLETIPNAFERVVAVMAPNLVMNFKQQLLLFCTGFDSDTIDTILHMKPNELEQALELNVPHYDKIIIKKMTTFRTECLLDTATYCVGKTLFIVDEAHQVIAAEEEAKMRRQEDEVIDLTRDESSKIFDVLKRCSDKGKVLLFTATPVVNSPTDVLKLLMLVNGKPFRSDMLNTLVEKNAKYDDFSESARIAFQAERNMYEGKVLYLNELLLGQQGVKYPQQIFETVATVLADDEYADMLHAVYENNKQDVAHGRAIMHTLTYTVTAEDGTIGGRARPKLKRIVSDIESILSSQQEARIIVFCAYLERGISALRQMLHKKGIMSCSFTGEEASIRQPSVEVEDESMSGDDLNEKSRIMFQDGKCRVILVTFGSGGCGVDLSHATHVLFAHKPWTSAAYIQAVARAVRPSRTTSDDKMVEIRMYTCIFQGSDDTRRRVVEEIRRKSGLKLQGLSGKGLTGDEILENIVEAKNRVMDPYIEILRIEGLKTFITSLESPSEQSEMRSFLEPFLLPSVSSDQKSSPHE